MAPGSRHPTPKNAGHTRASITPGTKYSAKNGLLSYERGNTAGACPATLTPMDLTGCPSCSATQGFPCRSSDGATRVLPHPARLLAATLRWLIPLLVRWIPVRERWVLARALITRDDPPPDAPTGDQPEWDRVRLRLLFIGDTARQINHDLKQPHLFVDFTDLATCARVLGREANDAYKLICQANTTPGLRLDPGDDLAVLRHKIDVRRGELLDADLALAHRETDPEAASWTIGYQPDGAFQARTIHTDGTVPWTLWGAAPTPWAAAHTVTGFFHECPPALVFDPAPTTADRPLTPHAVPRNLPHSSQLIKQLLARRGVAYDEHIAACVKAKGLLGAAVVEEYLAERAQSLNTHHPQLADADKLGDVGAPINRDHAGSVQTAYWVPTSLVVATGNRPWGEFGSHRPEVPEQIAHGLRGSDNLEAFTEELFEGGPIDLTRIPAWAGPLYTVGSNGNHRTHAARMLDLPWLAAVVHYNPPATRWDLLGILAGDPEEDHHVSDERWEQRHHERLMLIAGLLRRRIIHGELVGPDPKFPTLACRWLPAPWLLREAVYTTRINTVYEVLYPGALLRLGIPEGVGTDPEAWTAWLTT